PRPPTPHRAPTSLSLPRALPALWTRRLVSRFTDGSGSWPHAEFLEGMGIERDQAGTGGEGVRHFHHVQPSPRVDAKVVRRDEIPRRAAVGAAPAGQQPSPGVKDTHATGLVFGDLAVHLRALAHPPPQLRDVDPAF